MKVEIVTLHRITNFGSMLQTLATQYAVEKLGYEAEVLDFVPEGMTFRRACFPKNAAPFSRKLIKCFPLFVVNTVQFHILDRFLHRYIHLSASRYGSFSAILRNVPEADIYMTGSDQVWNTQNNNPREDYLAYFLAFVPEEKKRISYAGSFGKNTFTEDERQTIKTYLKKYAAVSVREDEALDILEDNGIAGGMQVVDPTLLLSPSEWDTFLDVKPPRPGYIFVYNLNRNPLLKSLAHEISKEKNLRIVNFADSLDFVRGADNRLFNTAVDFLNHIKYADIVLTDSFHGTAFSLNYSKQFVCVPAPRYNSRIESILRMVGLSSRLICDSESGLSAANDAIPYTEVSEKIDAMRDSSVLFLRRVLQNG